MPAKEYEWFPEYKGPTTEQYEFALSQITISDREKAMLCAHYFAHHGSATPLQLAQTMGWTNQGVTNLAVGRLGRKIATALDMVHELPTLGKKRTPQLWCAYNQAFSRVDGFFWILRPAFVEALVKEPWMHPPEP